MTTDDLERAFTSTRAVLARITPDQMSLPTPCRSWTVRDVVNHVVGNSGRFGATVDAGASPPAVDEDHTAGDFLATYDRGVQQSVAAFARAGALDQVLKLHFGEIPAAGYLHIATTDTFAHGWDLARATGQSTDLDPELAAVLLERSRAFIQPSFRGDDTLAPFGAEQPAPPNATNADAFAAFLGRHA